MKKYIGMKKLFLLAVFMLIGLSLSAQDVIVRRNGQTVEAKVTEVNPDNVRYKRFDNPDGPTFTILISDIQSITYENGSTDVFEAPAAAAPAPAQKAAAQEESDELFALNPDMLRDGLRYKKIKRNYVKTDYVYLQNPRYSTSRAWWNVLVPGVAQFSMGEVGLGIRYMFFNAAWYTLSSVYLFLEEPFPIGKDFYLQDEGTICFLLGMSGQILNTVLSIVNATKVAKVKSLYYHDLNVLHRSGQISFDVTPVVLPYYSQNGLALAPGIGMQLKF